VLAHEQLQSGESLLDLRIATSSARPVANHVLVLVHGLPRAMGMGRQAAGLLPELAEHLANESGWLVATGTLSGVGGSTGTFSATQWRKDLHQILSRVERGDQRISLAGFGFGGALALALAAEDDRVRGVATFASPAHLEPWCGAAEEFRRSVKVAGVVGSDKDLLAAEELTRWAQLPRSRRGDCSLVTVPTTLKFRRLMPAIWWQPPKVERNFDSSKAPVISFAPIHAWSRRY
jgi:pimeloyl-ACP methyl ester carboxylesterase